MHKSIFALITYGNGGWVWRDVYNMPVHYRNLYLHELMQVKEKEKAQQEYIAAQAAAHQKSKQPFTPFKPSVPSR